MRRLAIAGLCWAGLTAAETVPRCTGDALGLLWLPDLPRTSARWQAGPLATLCARPWARAAFARLDPWWSHLGVAPDRILAALTEAQAIHGTAERRAGTDDDPRLRLDLHLGTGHRGEALAAIADGLLPLPTRLGPGGPRAWLAGSWDGLLRDGVFTIRHTPVPMPVAADAPAPLPDGLAADVTLVMRPALIELASALADGEIEPQEGYEQQSVAITCTAYGLHERSEQILTADYAQAVADLRLPAIDRGRFNALPATTLCALVTRCDRASTRALLDRFLPAGNADVAAIDAVLARVQLGDFRSLLLSVDGDVEMFVEAGSPFPLVTAAITMDEAMAQALLERLDERLGLVVGSDGTHAGLLGVLPFAAVYRNGHLELTTDPLGFAGVASRRGGFTTHPEVGEALAQIPPDALVAAVSRSGASWEAVGRLALLGLMRVDLPQIATMPRDLAQAGRFGFLSYALRDGVVVCDAGGLFGGPVCWVLALAGGGLAATELTLLELRQPAPVAAPPVVDEAQ